ncbi:MAG: hypothetical protein COZ18_07300 [Flexibacter sp. CG_4_10_14_3_um_filter_32_15]|nr:MAG: hypothetical protein COZ18_07300 [Flexibacter sp. CG_4_10_14_3_um_filter_32_15]
MSKIRILFDILVFFVLQSNAFASFSEIGGLYYSYQTQESIYIKWDFKASHATAIYWAKGNNPYQRFEIMTQYDKSTEDTFTDFINHYIQIWQTDKPTVSYELNLFAASFDDIRAINLNKKGNTQKTQFMQIASQDKISFTEQAKPNALLTEAITTMEWGAFNPQIGEMDDYTTVAMGQDDVLNRFSIVVSNDNGNVYYESKIEHNLSIKAATEGFKDYSINVKIDVVENIYWRLSFYAPTGEWKMALLQRNYVNK